ncbi:DNA/RNA helicase domain-containing protein [Weissella paramesenteroides]
MTNSALEKFNVTALTENQVEQLTKIENYIQKQLQQATNSVVVIEGAAGTGKSVILTKLFEKLQRGTKEPDSAYYGLKNKFTVNHPELLKVYQELSETVTSLKRATICDQHL